MPCAWAVISCDLALRQHQLVPLDHDLPLEHDDPLAMARGEPLGHRDRLGIGHRRSQLAPPLGVRRAASAPTASSRSVAASASTHRRRCRSAPRAAPRAGRRRTRAGRSAALAQQTVQPRLQSRRTRPRRPARMLPRETRAPRPASAVWNRNGRACAGDRQASGSHTSPCTGAGSLPYGVSRGGLTPDGSIHPAASATRSPAGSPLPAAPSTMTASGSWPTTPAPIPTLAS